MTRAKKIGAMFAGLVLAASLAACANQVTGTGQAAETSRTTSTSTRTTGKTSGFPSPTGTSRTTSRTTTSSPTGTSTRTTATTTRSPTGTTTGGVGLTCPNIVDKDSKMSYICIDNSMDLRPRQPPDPRCRWTVADRSRLAGRAGIGPGHQQPGHRWHSRRRSPPASRRACSGRQLSGQSDIDDAEEWQPYGQRPAGVPDRHPDYVGPCRHEGRGRNGEAGTAERHGGEAAQRQLRGARDQQFPTPRRPGGPDTTPW